MTTDPRICPSCKTSPVNPGTALCQRCHTNAGMLGRVMPALLAYLQNHPRPEAVAYEMCDLLMAISRLGLADTEPMHNGAVLPDDEVPDDSYPLEWLLEAPPLDEDEPEGVSAIIAVLSEITLGMLEGGGFRTMYAALCDQLDATNGWRSALLESLVATRNLMLATQGRELSAARLREDIEIARTNAAREALK